MLLCRGRGAVLQQLQEHNHSFISVSRSLQRKVVRLDERQEVPAILRGGWGRLTLLGKEREVCDEGNMSICQSYNMFWHAGCFFLLVLTVLKKCSWEKESERSVWAAQHCAGPVRVLSLSAARTQGGWTLDQEQAGSDRTLHLDVSVEVVVSGDAEKTATQMYHWTLGFIHHAFYIFFIIIYVIGNTHGGNTMQGIVTLTMH